MMIGRRAFLAGAGALAVSARSAFAGAQTVRPGAIFPSSVRADFPSVALETYMNSASMHPLGTFRYVSSDTDGKSARTDAGKMAPGRMGCAPASAERADTASAPAPARNSRRPIVIQPPEEVRGDYTRDYRV